MQWRLRGCWRQLCSYSRRKALGFAGGLTAAYKQLPIQNHSRLCRGLCRSDMYCFYQSQPLQEPFHPSLPRNVSFYHWNALAPSFHTPCTTQHKPTLLGWHRDEVWRQLAGACPWTSEASGSLQISFISHLQYSWVIRGGLCCNNNWYGLCCEWRK